jgi:hypothetical protein
MNKIFFLLLIMVGLGIGSCKKDNEKLVDCLTNELTVRQIVDKQATVKRQASGVFHIIEQGSIDNKLNPCNLQTEFQIDNLLVIISGDVKETIQVGTGPCCTENFVIKKITR